MRLGAQWDTDCAFEANYNWKQRMIDLFSINTLTDANGEPYKQALWDDPFQADMCEIMRTLISKGILRDKENKTVKLNELHEHPDVFDNIECAKINENAGGICAVAGSSYFEKTGWTILFGGDSIGV